MLKAIGATLFGLACVAGAGYLYVRNSKDEALKTKVNTLVGRLKTNMNSFGDSLKAFFNLDDQPTAAETK